MWLNMCALAAERLTIQSLLRDTLNEWPFMKDKPVVDIARRIERSCNNASIDQAKCFGIVASFAEPKYVNLYSSQCSRVVANLSVETAFNSYLIDKIAAGEIDANTIADLKNADLNPDAAINERTEIALRQNQKTELKVSRLHTCRRCNGNETTKIEYQSSAADEASSHSIKCICCGYVWRK